MAANDLNVAKTYEAVTKSDTVNYTNSRLARGLYIGGAGVVILVMEDDTTCSFTVPAGTILPCQHKRVNSTSTTATLMVALF